MKYDFWKTERETAEVINGLKVLKKDSENKFSVMMWTPKATKPYVNYYFRDAAKRDAYIASQVENFVKHQESKKEERAKRIPTAEDLKKVQVGDIFYNSWGYEQTNVDFYQVVALSGQSVTIRKIQSKMVRENAFMSGFVVAVKDAFVERAEPTKKRLKFYEGKPSIGSCYPWDGREQFCSWYA